MKKLFFLLISVALIGFYSCEKDSEPAIDTNTIEAPVLTMSLEAGTDYQLMEEEGDQIFTTCSWTEVNYNFSENLANPTYSFQVSFDPEFGSFQTIAQAVVFADTITVAEMNDKLIAMGAEAGVSKPVYFRVVAYVVGLASQESVSSAVLTYNIAPFEAAIVVPPLYLLGDGTTAGWDNNTTLEMNWVEGTTYSITTDLLETGWFKVIQTQGQWAPMWGTVEGAAWDSGTLIFRSTEADPDPQSIPVPGVAGLYTITVDIEALTYTVVEAAPPVPEFFILGEATTAGWDNTIALPMNGTGGEYTLTTTLVGQKLFKFIGVLGQWQPQYGGDDETTAIVAGQEYTLYSSEVLGADPSGILAPGDVDVATEYTITVSLNNMTYKIE